MYRQLSNIPIGAVASGTKHGNRYQFPGRQRAMAQAPNMGTDTSLQVVRGPWQNHEGVCLRKSEKDPKHYGHPKRQEGAQNKRTPGLWKHSS